eukprot:2124735-Rhodomonas_salina.1
MPQSTPPVIATDTLDTIGYISADFVDHPTADLAIATILHQSRRYRVYCYALTPDDGSEYRARLREELGDRLRERSARDTDK